MPRMQIRREPDARKKQTPTLSARRRQRHHFATQTRDEPKTPTGGGATRSHKPAIKHKAASQTNLGRLRSRPSEDPPLKAATGRQDHGFDPGLEKTNGPDPRDQHNRQASQNGLGGGGGAKWLGRGHSFLDSIHHLWGVHTSYSSSH